MKSMAKATCQHGVRNMRILHVASYTLHARVKCAWPSLYHITSCMRFMHMSRYAARQGPRLSAARHRVDRAMVRAAPLDPAGQGIAVAVSP